MSQRSIQRANARREAKDRRRQALRRRRAGLAAGAAIGATAVFAMPAQAATFPVTSTADGPADACDADCTLRDAVEAADAAAGADTVTFASGVTGTITLTEGQIQINGELTISGPGRTTLTVSGDDTNRIFQADAATTISGLTLTEGLDSGNGGAIHAGSPLTVTDSTISESRANGRGGGIYAGDELTLENTIVSGNSAPGGGGGISTVVPTSGGKYEQVSDPVAVSSSRITGNTSDGRGAGILAAGPLEVDGSTLSENVAGGDGGGIFLSSKYAPLDITGSTISLNSADRGGGLVIRSLAGLVAREVDRTITGATIADNEVLYEGAGIDYSGANTGDTLTIVSSTLSGNTAEGDGGGISVEAAGGLGKYVAGEFLLSNSTVSVNEADSGAGIRIGDGADGELEAANSTIAANRAGSDGGGIHLAAYETEAAEMLLTSTVVGDNTAAGAPEDLDRQDDAESGGFDLAFSLVEAPGDAPLFQSDGDPNITGVDPQLGPLANNGGANLTHLPSPDGPLIDKGDAPARLDSDQRGRPRAVDHATVANPPGGDGSDIGSVEQADGPTPRAEPEPEPEVQVVPGPPGPPVILDRVPVGGFKIRVNPRRDLTAPFRFRTRGRIVPPGAMSLGEACNSPGFVAVQVKFRGVTVSTRRARLLANCTFSSRVTFRFPQRFRNLMRGPGRMRLKFVGRFSGNQRLEPAVSKAVLRRIR